MLHPGQPPLPRLPGQSHHHPGKDTSTTARAVQDPDPVDGGHMSKPTGRPPTRMAALVSNFMRELCPACSTRPTSTTAAGAFAHTIAGGHRASWRRIQELGPFTTDVWPFIGAGCQHPKAPGQLCGVARNRLALSENVTSGCVLPLWGLPFVERSPVDRRL